MIFQSGTTLFKISVSENTQSQNAEGEEAKMKVLISRLVDVLLHSSMQNKKIHANYRH